MNYKQTPEYKRILATILKILEKKAKPDELATLVYFDCQIEYAKMKDEGK